MPETRRWPVIWSCRRPDDPPGARAGQESQLHQGTAGSATFVNVAVWESARALGRAFSSPEFQARVARYPDSTVAAPHVFKKVAVPGICVA